MDDNQKAIGAGGCKVLAAGATYDASVDNSLPEVYEMVILTAGTVTTLEAKTQTKSTGVWAQEDIKAKVLGAYESNADIAKVPITFKEGEYLNKIVSGTIVVMLYFVLKK